MPSQVTATTHVEPEPEEEGQRKGIVHRSGTAVKKAFSNISRIGIRKTAPSRQSSSTALLPESEKTKQGHSLTHEQASVESSDRTSTEDEPVDSSARSEADALAIRGLETYLRTQRKRRPKEDSEKETGEAQPTSALCSTAFRDPLPQ